MSLIFIDVDDKLQEIEQITQKLHDQFPHYPMFISFQSLEEKEIEELKRKELNVVSFFKRPYQLKEIFKLANEYHGKLLADNPR